MDGIWTVFCNERENPCDRLDARVFVLTGDLHNNFEIRIIDNVGEFASVLRNSVSHRPEDEANCPVQRDVQIWSAQM